MEAKELMINDWYQWYAEGKYYFHQVKAEDFAKDYVANFEPITLTAEILQLNGFELEPSGLLWQETTYKLDRVYVEVSFLHDGSMRKVEVCNNIRTSYMSYFEWLHVHTFQHILRNCGLTELADNFKVK